MFKLAAYLAHAFVIAPYSLSQIGRDNGEPHPHAGGQPLASRPSLICLLLQQVRANVGDLPREGIAFPDLIFETALIDQPCLLGQLAHTHCAGD
jgi:hypothetical protein